MSSCEKVSFCGLLQGLSHIGQFLIGLAAVITLWKSDGILEKIREIKETIDLIRVERINIQQLRITSMHDPEIRVELFKELIKPENNKLALGNLYLSDEEYKKALDILKSNDRAAQTQFLQQKVKVWDKAD